VNGAKVFTTTWIYGNYPGEDNQEMIRNFIRHMYLNHDTNYVLLGGDVKEGDPENSVVPYRGFYIYTGGYSDSDMAADMYYGHLDGNWNTDGDSRFAEPGEEDWYAEVAVGRAPVDNTTQAQAFVDKVIAYEHMEKPDLGSRKRVCFHQSRVQTGNSPDSRCLAWNCDDWIPGDYTIEYLFEENGTVTKNDWINAWAAGPIVVVHIGLGITNAYHINYELGGTISWYNSDVPSMTNTFFPWTTSTACICGQFTANDCLAEEYVKDDCGAIGAIYNDNYGWFSTMNACMYSGEFCEMEVRACWSDGYEKLGDILNRSRYYMAGPASSNPYYRWCYYERNLMGDPETSCLDTRDEDKINVCIPADGSDVHGTVDITACTCGSIDKVKFYINDEYKDTDYQAPFDYSWDTTSCPEDTTATIKVEGYYSDVLIDDKTITVTVNNQYVEFTYPEEGDIVSETVIITTDTRNIDTVEFYIDDILVYTDTVAPFQYEWETCSESNGSHTLKTKGYYSGQFVDEDIVTCQVSNNPSVVITDPTDQEEVWDTVTITVDSSCIDKVEFYIDGILKYTDHTGPPFQYEWDTTTYSDGSHTIYVKGFYYGVFKDDDTITVTVNNHHIDITNPSNRAVICIGTPVNITTSTTACIDTVKFYLIWIVNDEISGELLCTDTETPFGCSWNTTGYSAGWYTIRAEAYSSGVVYSCCSLYICENGKKTLKIFFFSFFLGFY
jgi:hypothetical protein